MQQCTCVVQRGLRKNIRCPKRAKYPPENPAFCREHVGCSRRVGVRRPSKPGEEVPLGAWAHDQTGLYGPGIFAFNRRTPWATHYQMPRGMTAELRVRVLAMMSRIVSEFPLHPNLWLLGVAYFDRYLAAVTVFDSESAMKLGEAALFTATVFLEGLREQSAIRELAVNNLQLKPPPDLLLEMAEKLEYRFRVPTPFDFLRRLQSVILLTRALFWRAAAVGDVTLFSHELLRFHPALITAASVAAVAPAERARAASLMQAEEAEVLECQEAIAEFVSTATTAGGTLKAALDAVVSLYGFEDVGELLADGERPRSGQISSTGAVRPLTPVHGQVSLAGAIARGLEQAPGRQLGRGTFGEVRVVTVGGIGYAVKLFQRVDVGLSSDFMMEAAVMQQVESDYIVATSAIGVEHGVPFIAMELCTANLHDIISGWPKENTPAVSAAITVYTRDILRGLVNIHEVGLVHGDLKPENVLICGGKVKLADFGLAQWQTPPYRKSTDQIYSEPYGPPEHKMGGQIVRPSSDLWALGCVVAEMNLREVPFRFDALHSIFETLGSLPVYWTEGRELLAKTIEEGEFYTFSLTPAPFDFAGLSPWIEAVVSQTLRYDPDQRTPARLLLEQAPLFP